jgi:hypothetical protein
MMIQHETKAIIQKRNELNVWESIFGAAEKLLMVPRRGLEPPRR